ncbi:LPXTG cell wall anchor domain-containing protein [Lactobacillus pasteurii]|uniref:LPXTG cell wall anchor domain-containing protein n=1 Tax=Lactobacillus pasteurii TaxID=872327 RepID=UPI0009DA5622|nr:LPXTG cell wall anchor domain-containing protein [Lactobacillus pasteurii]
MDGYTPDKPVTPNKDTDVPNTPSDNNTNTTTNTGNGETPATTVSEKSTDQQLPQTGEKDSSLLSLIGLGMLAATGLYAGKRKRD